MKKIYQKPEIKIVKVQMAQVMAGSSEEVAIGEDVGDASGAEARRGGFWDDEDE